MLKLKNENEHLENYNTLELQNKTQLAQLLTTIDKETLANALTNFLAELGLGIQTKPLYEEDIEEDTEEKNKSINYENNL